ncbi:hypothetical protein E1202_04420 [Saccharopolyspora karakumensis]|uniref:Uncharacterized protein n=1 Tax=Saccharopolyspora karakumensis TaxID=2530386 RepID=A0A4R5C542_9PSEU|nr:hypothetical protein [Saccharopolyspora karakumensis]TDD91982.1 hypothetical protein E1202_04420 [Saccharopolyspora karakumensis]
MIDRTQQTDRPSRKVLTGIAIAACGGVIALLLEYFVIQPWLAPETDDWNSNSASSAVGGVSAGGEIEHADGQVRVTGKLEDRAQDNKGVSLIILVDGKEHRPVAVTKGAHESAEIDVTLPDTATIAVRECLTHPKKPVEDRECSDALTIWPQHSP